MRVLLALNSSEKEEEKIVQTYKEKYGETIEVTSVYFFKSLIDTVKKSAPFDRIVIHENLEPTGRKNKDVFDEYIFKNIDALTDESGNATIIFISNTSRKRDDSLLTKLFNVGIYNILIGEEGTFSRVCELIKNPMTKKDAKRILEVNVNAQTYENPNQVSEIELRNILEYFEKNKSNKENIISGFDNNLYQQYTMQKLRIIISVLPEQVKKILNENSDKYRAVLSEPLKIVEVPVYMGKETKNQTISKPKKGLFSGLLKKDKGSSVPSQNNITNNISDTVVEAKNNITNNRPNEFKPTYRTEKPTVIVEVKEGKNVLEETLNSVDKEISVSKVEVPQEPKKEVLVPEIEVPQEPKKEISMPEIEVSQEPKKEIPVPEIEIPQEPKKEIPVPEIEIPQEPEKEIPVPEIEIPQEPEKEIPVPEIEVPQEPKKEISVPEVEVLQEPKKEVPIIEDPEQSIYDVDNTEANNEKDNFNSGAFNNATFNNGPQIQTVTQVIEREVIKEVYETPSDYKKTVAFIGAHKVGTTFIINAIANNLVSKGIKTAILDLTKNKDTYKIYAANSSEARDIAGHSIPNLAIGQDIPLKLGDLSIYTGIPRVDRTKLDSMRALEKIRSQNAVILVDCDFTTNIDIFRLVNNIFIIQDMDMLNILDITSFLRELKVRDIDLDKAEVIVNKYMKSMLSVGKIVEALSYFTNPEMTFVNELLPSTVERFVVPFDEQNYLRYIEGIYSAKLIFEGFSEEFKQAIASIVYNIFPISSTADISAQQQIIRTNNSGLMNMFKKKK